MAAVKRILFIILSPPILFIGWVVIEMVWTVSSNFNLPETGYYYGELYGSFLGGETNEPFYTLYFDGQSSSRWCWSFPKTFNYTKVHAKWADWDNPGFHESTIDISPLANQPSLENDVLAEKVLSEIFPKTNPGTPKTRKKLSNFLCDAANGTLPPARNGFHKNHETQMVVGYSVSPLSFLWFFFWFILAGCIGKKLFTRKRDF